MPNYFFCSDQHLGHANILTFFHNDGITRVRDFSSVEEMNEHIIDKHNSVVKPDDYCYFLGDFAWNTDSVNLDFAGRLNGKKLFIPGNHDHFPMSEYEKYFEISYSGKKFGKRNKQLILSHYPVHPDCLGICVLNVCGHTHQTSIQDPRYFNVSMEAIDYTPVHYDQLVNYINLYL